MNAGEFTADYPRVEIIGALETIDHFKVVTISEPEGIGEFLDSLKYDVRVSLANPYFLARPDNPMLAGRTFCCKFVPLVSFAFIDSLNEEYGVEIESENDLTPKLFLLRVGDHSPLSTLEIANLYCELPGTEFCHPNFLGGYEWNSYFIYDHYWGEQWAMHRIFNTAPTAPDSMNHRAFLLTLGDTNVIVAVLDMGIAPHEDLSQARLSPGYDFERMDNDPTPCDWPNQGWHGMGVAGIIGASHNRYSELQTDKNTGVYGISPLCKIMPLKIGSGVPVPDWAVPDTGFTPHCWSYFATDDRIAGAIEWA